MMQVCFRKAWNGILPDNWAAILISAKTWSDVYHVELKFSNGECITASSAINNSKEDGVMIRPVDTTGNMWECFDIDITKFGYHSEEECYKRALKLKEKNKGYAWDDIIFNELLGFNTNDKSRFYCSEVVAYLLKLYPSQVNAGELKAIIKKKLAFWSKKKV